MDENSTLTDLFIRYLYKETSAGENKTVLDLLGQDYSLREEFYELRRMISLLDEEKAHEPSQLCLDSILEYSMSKDGAKVEEAY